MIEEKPIVFDRHFEEPIEIRHPNSAMLASYSADVPSGGFFIRAGDPTARPCIEGILR